MIQDLYQIQSAANVLFDESGTIAISYNNDAAAILATRQGVAVCNRSHWGRLQVSGADRIRFLHNQSTNNFNALQPGQGCDTVFVTSTARTLDLATAYLTEEAVLLLVSPNRSQRLMEWLDRYLFPMDKVVLKDITQETAAFSLIGPDSAALLEKLKEKLGANNLADGETGPNVQPYGSHQLITLGDIEVRLAVGSGLATVGYTLMVSAQDAAILWNTLLAAGAAPMGERVWEQLRIEQGRPVPDHELTEDYNPLEARLWQTISFEKGCYIGQETIARLNTYKGVKQELWGVRLKGAAAPGTVVTIGEEKVGKLTSYTETEDGHLGLAYIKTKAGGIGLTVQVGETVGEIVDVPFLTQAPQ